MPAKPEKHNATCYLCGETFTFDYFTKTGQDKRGEWNEGHKCSVCRRANKESKDDKMSKYTWRSLKEIDASWGGVKRGQLWEAALEKFARSLPVSEQQQDALIEAMTNE